MLHIFRINTLGASNGLGFRATARIDDLLGEVLYFLYADIAKQVAPGLSQQEQLEHTAFALYASNVLIARDYYDPQRPIEEKSKAVTTPIDPAKRNRPARTLFGLSLVQRVAASPNHQQLLNLTLNAVEDLDEIKLIMERTPPQELPVLLSAKGTTHISHLENLNKPHSFCRTGTALQMAIYGDDEGVQAFLKSYMDPEEYERQAIEAFSMAIPLNTKRQLAEKKASALVYQQEAQAQQKIEAKNLCAKFKAAMNAADPAEFTVVRPRFIASTTSAAVDEAADTLKKELLIYTQENAIYNRYILDEIYQILAPLDKENRWFNANCYLSQHVLAEAQLLMPKRWAQHYAFGIHGIAQEKDMQKIRVSICSGSDKDEDVDSVMARLRSESICLDIFGARHQVGFHIPPTIESSAKIIKSNVEQKQSAVAACYAPSLDLDAFSRQSFT